MSTILIIDPEHQDFLRTVLLEQGHTIYTASTVITPHLTKNIDLILLDAGFRGSLIQECRIIQRYREGRGMPILVMSVLPALEAEAKQAGAAAFIEKPFDLNKFLLVVQDLLEY